MRPYVKLEPGPYGIAVYHYDWTLGRFEPRPRRYYQFYTLAYVAQEYTHLGYAVTY